MCFQKDGKNAQTERCIKSMIMTKLIDCVLSIDTFEQQCVVLKVILQSLLLKYHVHTIGIEQSLSINAIYEHKCLENMKNIMDEIERREILKLNRMRVLIVTSNSTDDNNHNAILNVVFIIELSNINM